ncbi:hypothetical protein AAU61_15205 [Desulfocarbo indianensis]|nr:hypothetical protein AAU61_15205 [Desulfocarbo indianensis]
MTQESQPLFLRLPLRPRFSSMATSFTESAALALGLEPPEALKLTLAAEEVFCYLAEAVQQDGDEQQVALQAVGRGYCVELRFGLPAMEIDLRLFNLAAPFSPDDESSLNQLGLLLASRSVDRFFLDESSEGGMELKLIKEKAYPSPAALETPSARPLTQYKVALAEPAQIKETARLIRAYYPPELFPETYMLPAKLADMAAGGEVRCLAAADKALNLGGAFFLRQTSRSTVLAYGPYIFGQPEAAAMAQALVEAALNQVAKTQAVAFVCRYPTPELPPEYFEPLGDLAFIQPDGQRRPWPHYFRQLKEDPGAVVWSHPRLSDFLRGKYTDLALARDIHATQDEGEGRPRHSLLGTHLERAQGHATLRPMLDGRDVRENLARHLEVLRGEGIANIFCNLDVGLAWHSNWMPPLMEEGFQPRLIVPFAGKGDLVLFQCLDGQA